MMKSKDNRYFGWFKNRFCFFKFNKNKMKMKTNSLKLIELLNTQPS